MWILTFDMILLVSTPSPPICGEYLNDVRKQQIDGEMVHIVQQMVIHGDTLFVDNKIVSGKVEVVQTLNASVIYSCFFW